MRRFICSAVGFGIAVALSTWMAASALAQFPDPKDEKKLYELAKKEGTLVWYGSSPLEAMRDMAKDFESKYPGIKTEILRIVGIAGYQRFLQETHAKQYIVDVLSSSDYPSVKSLVEQVHMAEWKVPTSERFSATLKIGHYSYSPIILECAIVYNINKVTPEEAKILKNWKGVLDPRFKGRFAVTSHKCGVCYAGVHMFLDPKNVKVFGPEFIKAVAAQKPTVYSDILIPLDRVIAGEHDFTYWSWEMPAYLKWMQGAPIRWIFPDPTPVFAATWYSISKYAPHPNTARLFQNWLMSESGANTALRTGYKAMLDGVKDTRKMLSEPWYEPIKNRYDVDFERWARDYNKDMDFWTKMMMQGK